MRLKCDIDYDETTRQIISEPDISSVLALMGQTPGQIELLHDAGNGYSFAFGALRHRASVLLQRAEAAEARVAELEAELASTKLTAVKTLDLAGQYIEDLEGAHDDVEFLESDAHRA